MSKDLWRWADPDGQQRRVRLDELRAALAGGLIAPNTPVWKSGWAAWQPAHEVPELTTSALSAANGVVPNIPPPPLAMLAAQHEFEAKAKQSFRPPAPSAVAGDEEPPPPPRFVPLPVKQASIPPAAGSSSRAVDAAARSATAPAPLPASLPTAIGLPPPPELAQMVAASKEAAAAKAAPPAPASSPAAIPARTMLGMPAPTAPASSPAVAKPVDPMIEELSGSMLLDEDLSARDVLGNQRGQGGAGATPALDANGLPAPTEPRLDASGTPSFSDDDIPGIPHRKPGLTLIFEDLQAIKAGKPPKNKLLLAVLGVVGLSVVIMLLALIVSAFSGKPSDVTTAGSASAGSAGAGAPSARATTATPSTATATSTTGTSTAAAIPPPPPKAEPKAPSGPSFGDCTIAGDAHIISPRAFIPSGVEVTAVPGGVALGFATTGRDAVAVTVDPTSLAITNTVKARALGGDVRRVTPIVAQGKLTVVPEVDKKEKIVGRRVVGTGTPIDIGVADNAIVWAPHGQASYATMFPLESEGGPIDALRGVPLATQKGVAVAYRRTGAVFVGLTKGDGVLVPIAPPQKLAGLGPQVGSPSIATSGDNVLVAWADRAANTDPWQVRWATIDESGTASAPKELTLPEGGLGNQAMSPAVAGLGGGRFVIAWTEGPVSNHQVRAVNVNADGSLSGGGLSVSAAGLNAGQPQVAVGADGRGVIAFLAKGKAFYEIHATPLTCAAK